MTLLLDLLYAVLALVASPWWLRKRRSGWGERFGRGPELPDPRTPRLLVHAVSVGEVNVLRTLVSRLLDDPDVDAEIVVSTTTDTGMARARELFGHRCHVVRFPLDASWSVRRFLNRVRPDGVALVELELWPNFLLACRRRRIPVGVINGRLSARSFRGYRILRPFLARFFRGLAFVAAQDEEYAARFRAMGADPAGLHVTGSMKWDAADTSDQAREAEALAEAMGIDRSRLLVVGGSTAPGEHELLRDALPGDAQLLCAPRRPEWFDEAARALDGCVRRSTGDRADADTRYFLLDTIGELRHAYALADIVVVGRSFGNLHGSDPMEPASLAKPVVIGPAVADFSAVVSTMKEAGAILQTTPEGLRGVLRELADDPDERSRMGERARVCVRENQGATDRNIALLRAMLGAR